LDFLAICIFHRVVPFVDSLKFSTRRVVTGSARVAFWDCISADRQLARRAVLLFLRLTVHHVGVDAKFLATLYVSLRSALRAVCDDIADDVFVVRGLLSWLMVRAGGNVVNHLPG
jgi:hypothetical protein